MNPTYPDYAQLMGDAERTSTPILVERNDGSVIAFNPRSAAYREAADGSCASIPAGSKGVVPAANQLVVGTVKIDAGGVGAAPPPPAGGKLPMTYLQPLNADQQNLVDVKGLQPYVDVYFSIQNIVARGLFLERIPQLAMITNLLISPDDQRMVQGGSLGSISDAVWDDSIKDFRLGHREGPFVAGTPFGGIPLAAFREWMGT